MKTINISLYSIDELSKEAQESALNNYGYINVDYDWWEDEYEDFTNVCKTMGISVDKIHFRGFYSHGDGSCFASTIDVSAFIKGVQSKAWKTYAPTLELNVEKCTVRPAVIDLIDSGVDIEIVMKTETHHRYYCIHYHSTHYVNSTRSRNHRRIEEELDKLDRWAENTLGTLNRYLYRNLKETYEHLTSEEVVSEAIKANGYLFTADGKMATRLLKLVDNQ